MDRKSGSRNVMSNYCNTQKTFYVKSKIRHKAIWRKGEGFAMNYYIADLHLFHKNMTAEGKNVDYTPRTLTEIQNRDVCTYLQRE